MEYQSATNVCEPAYTQQCSAMHYAVYCGIKSDSFKYLLMAISTVTTIQKGQTGNGMKQFSGTAQDRTDYPSTGTLSQITSVICYCRTLVSNKCTYETCFNKTNYKDNQSIKTSYDNEISVCVDVC